ncbi:MAG: methyltransferase family protein, partial [Candidatus Hermodarchaeia archaeon]
MLKSEEGYGDVSVSSWEQFKAIMSLPFMVLLVGPILFLFFSIWTGLPWLFLYPFSVFSLVVGIFPLAIGLIMMYKTIRAFATVGKGTLSPKAPTQHFVAVSLYRYLRNPMILGGLLVLLGEAIIFGSSLIFLWCGFFGVLNHIWFIKREEPDLERRFGDEYRQYKRNVPRWIPRRS